MRDPVIAGTLPRTSNVPIRLMVVAAVVGAVMGAAVTEAPIPVMLGLLLVPIIGWFAVAHPDLAVAVYAAVVYADLLSTLTHYHGVPPVARPVAVALLGVVLADRVIIRRDRLARSPLTWWLLAYGLIIALGLLFARDQHRVLTNVIEYARIALNYVIIINIVTKPKQLGRIVWAMLATGVFLSVLTIYQSATGDWGQVFGGLARSQVSDILGNVQAPRPGGTINDANYYGLSLVLLVPFALHVVSSARTTAMRIVGLLCCGALVLGVVLTYSRGDTIALLAVFGAAVVYKRIRLTTLLLVLCTAFLAYPLLPSDYLARIGTISSAISGNQQTISTDDSLRGRLGALRASFDTFKDHPVVGVGSGNASLYESRYVNGTNLAVSATGIPPHNLYLEIAAESGLLGIFVMLGIFVVAARSALEACRRLEAVHSTQLADLAGWFLISLFGYMVGSLFLHGAYIYQFWLLLSLISALWILARRASPSTREPQNSPIGAESNVDTLAAGATVSDKNDQ